jgi:Protein of unknown function (DUF2490)
MYRLCLNKKLFFKTGFFLLLMLCSFKMRAQTKTTIENNQVWIGYMTSTMVSPKYAIWNDVHFVPGSFGIIRSGLTRHFDNTSFTAGYAYAWLNPGGDKTSLTRNEQRPWCQLQFNLPVNPKTIFIQRTRYEARFRENVSQGEIVDGYTFTNRLRFMMSLKRTLGQTTGKSPIPYLAVADEVLLNFGQNAYNTFDQNRISLSFGLQKKNIQYQVGFMNRLVQATADKYVLNHTIVFWVTQKFDLKKMIAKQHPEKNTDN